MEQETYEDELPERPSKSQLKREDRALQDLAQELAALTAAQLARIPLDDRVKTALELAQRIDPHSNARRRQIRYAAGFFREIDVTPIRDALNKLRGFDAVATREHHALEAWRDRLINEGDSALAAFMAEYPRADRQKLRALLMDIHREREKKAPPRAARLLFKRLREEISGADAVD